MNAYELAKKMTDTGGSRNYIEEAANMLVELADRVAELEKQLEMYENTPAWQWLD